MQNEAIKPEAEIVPAVPSELIQIRDVIMKGETPAPVSVRTLLRWFRAQRRGYYVVETIRSCLQSLGIQTDPEFNSVWIDSNVSFVPLAKEAAANEPGSEAVDVIDPGTGLAGMEVTQVPPNFVGGSLEDPTYRIGKLEAANKKVVSVTPNEKISVAVTLMLASGFSQLPVMQGERDVKGVVSWESIGARLALGQSCDEVRECLSPAQIIGSDKSLFAAIELIAQHQYVLVQALDRKISGIVTSADLSRQFQQLTEPFLLLGEIEQHVRRLIDGKFTPQELECARDPVDTDREIETVADLSMGEYIRLLENPKYWEKLSIRIDRAAFVEQLQTIRRIRNDIMHFDPDPLGKEDLASLRSFVAFMQSLRELGVLN